MSAHEALIADENANLKQAARLYYDLLNEENSIDATAYLNAAALFYLCATEPSIDSQVDPDLGRICIEIGNQFVIRLVNADLDSGEARFWQLYSRWLNFDEDTGGKIAQLFHETGCRMAVIYLINNEKREKYIEAAEGLIEDISTPKSERERYAKSVIESVLRR